MIDDSIEKAKAHVPAIGEHNQDILDDITYGLENLKDSRELAVEHNLRVIENTKDKPSVNWPNKNTSLTLGMAEGLEALETLGSSSFKGD